MMSQVNLSIEWEGNEFEEDIQDVSSCIGAIAGATVEVQVERSLGGLEIVVYTIVISMATRVGEIVVDSLSSAIDRVLSVSSAKEKKSLTINAVWEGGEIRIVLPLDSDERRKICFDAIGKLVSSS